jgi:predicted HTH transcriptional regulator
MLRANPASMYNNLTEGDFLEKLQISNGEHLTYGGLLFMGKNLSINRAIGDFRVDLLEIPGLSYADASPRYTFRLEEQENLWEYYFALIERLRRQIPNIPYKLDEYGVGIDDSPQFDAIREALVNLLMHCDYFSLMKPRIRIFRNRIEFENPGAFPRSIEELKKIDISLPRNPVIAKLFRSVKLADNAGYGIDKMLKWEKETGTVVSFQSHIDYSVLTFLLSEKPKEENDNIQVREQVREQVEKLLSVFDNENHNTYNLMLKMNLKNRPKFSSNYIQPALKAGIIEMTIPDKPNSRLQKYRLTEQGRKLKEKLQNK